MYTTQMTITPKMAAEMLTRNKRNRRLSAQTVRSYAKAMKEGKWQLTPDCISFYESGELRDGQHRLNAVVMAEVPVEMTVAYDVPNGSIICDKGKPRSILDILRMNDLPPAVANKNSVSMACGLFRYIGPRDINPSYIVEFLVDEAEYIEDVYYAAGKGDKSLPRRAPVMAAVYTAYRAGVPFDVLDRFCAVVGTGFCTSEGESAAVVIRNKLLESGALRDKPSAYVFFKATLKAIRDFERGVPRKKMYQDSQDALPYIDTVKTEVLSKYL